MNDKTNFGSMREIKFRAWDDADQEMSYFSFIHNLVCINDKDDLHICSDNGGWSFFRVGLHIMQFTGLKDKNRKEIYEEDIVRLHDRAGTESPVTFEAGAFSHGMSPIRDFIQAHWVEGEDCERLEVIGNIYENPELLV